MAAPAPPTAPDPLTGTAGTGEGADREASALQPNFDYGTAFSRNIGWLTLAEQQRLRRSRVAIAGLGGVGGVHLLTLARLGVGGFSVADFDVFELHNFNRQAGATVSRLGVAKTSAMSAMALDINPELDLRLFDGGVDAANVEQFLDGAHAYVDGIDFFAIEARRLIFAACRRRGIPALTAAPLGMGVALLHFDPRAMSFEDYFRLEGQSHHESLLRFIAGLSPGMLQAGYLADPAAVDLARGRVPSTVMACELCAGVMATEVLKVLLGRGPVRAAPWAMQFDAYRQRLRWSWRPFGNANPLQRMLLAVLRRRLVGAGQ